MQKTKFISRVFFFFFYIEKKKKKKNAKNKVCFREGFFFFLYIKKNGKNEKLTRSHEIISH